MSIQKHRIVSHAAQPLLVTSAIIIKGKDILLIRRSRPPYYDQWALPGGCGAFLLHKDPNKAVVKEVVQDIGCMFKGTLFTVSYFAKPVPTVSLYYVGKITGTPEPNGIDVAETEWKPLRTAARMQLGFDHNHIIKTYLKKHGRRT